MSLLSVSGVSVRLGGLQILDDVSLTVPEGAIVGLIGPNGAGKTTLFNVISGFVPMAAGHLEWRGRQRTMHPHQLAGLGIARTLQGVGLFDSMTVLENVAVGAHSTIGFGLDSSRRALHRVRDVTARAQALLVELDLADVASRYPADLPYPVRKRVVLARALMADPALVMLDEPAGGLAQSDIDDLAMLVRSLTPRCAVLVVEHHMDFVMSTCNHIYVLDAGRIIAEGDPNTIQRNSDVRAAYLGVEQT